MPIMSDNKNLNGPLNYTMNSRNEYWYHRKAEELNLWDYSNIKETLKYLSLMTLLDLGCVAEFFTKLSLVTLKKSSICLFKFLINFIKKAFMLNNGCNTIYCTIQYPTCWSLGRTAKLRF